MKHHIITLIKLIVPALLGGTIAPSLLAPPMIMPKKQESLQHALGIMPLGAAENIIRAQIVEEEQAEWLEILEEFNRKLEENEQLGLHTAQAYLENIAPLAQTEGHLTDKATQLWRTTKSVALKELKKLLLRVPMGMLNITQDGLRGVSSMVSSILAEKVVEKLGSRPPPIVLEFIRSSLSSLVSRGMNNAVLRIKQQIIQTQIQAQQEAIESMTS